MKKLILTLAAAFLLIQFADAQIFQFGIKGGLGVNKLKMEDLSSPDAAYELATGDNVVGYHLGIQTRIKLAMLYVQPELYFNDAGGCLTHDNGVDIRDINIEIKRIDLSVLLGLKFGPARVGIGPVGSFVVKDEVVTSIAEIEPDASIFTSSMTWGFQAGIGLDLSKISLDVRYEGALNKLGDSFDVGTSNFKLDARPSQWVFSLGFWF